MILPLGDGVGVGVAVGVGVGVAVGVGFGVGVTVGVGVGFGFVPMLTEPVTYVVVSREPVALETLRGVGVFPKLTGVVLPFGAFAATSNLIVIIWRVPRV